MKINTEPGKGDIQEALALQKHCCCSINKGVIIGLIFNCIIFGTIASIVTWKRKDLCTSRIWLQIGTPIPVECIMIIGLILAIIGLKKGKRQYLGCTFWIWFFMTIIVLIYYIKGQYLSNARIKMLNSNHQITKEEVNSRRKIIVLIQILCVVDLLMRVWMVYVVASAIRAIDHIVLTARFKKACTIMSIHDWGGNTV